MTDDYQRHRVSLVRLNELATLPTRATWGSYGFDLYCANHEVIHVYPKEYELIPTGWRLGNSLDESLVMLIFPRSSLITRGLIIPNAPGLIDADYTEEIKILVYNVSDKPVRIVSHERLAQIVFMHSPYIHFVEVPGVEVNRQRGGFGSTGK